MIDAIKDALAVSNESGKDLTGALLGSEAGRELARVGLAKDVPYCAQVSKLSVVPMLGEDGVLRR